MSDFRHPVLKELTEQLAGTDKRKSLVPVGKRRAQFERAGQLLGRDRPGEELSVPVRLLPSHRVPLGRLPGTVDSWGGPAARPEAADRAAGPVAAALADRAGGRTAVDARPGEPAVEGVGQDGPPVEDQLRSGRPASAGERPAARRLPGGGGGPVCGHPPRPGRTRRPVLAPEYGGEGRGIDPRPAPRPWPADRSPPSAAGSGKCSAGRPRRSATRSRTSTASTRRRRCSRTAPARWTARPSRSSITLTGGGLPWTPSPNASAHPDIDVPGHQRSPGPAACWSSPWITSTTPPSTTRRRRPRSSAPMPGPTEFEEQRARHARPQGRAAGAGAALRGAAAEQGAGTAPVPQDELPQAQGCAKLRRPVP